MHMAACLPIILCNVCYDLRRYELHVVNENSLLMRSMAINCSRMRPWNSPSIATKTRRRSFLSGLRVMRPSCSSSSIRRNAVVTGRPEARQRLVTETWRSSIRAAQSSKTMAQTGSPCSSPTARRRMRNSSISRRTSAFSCDPVNAAAEASALLGEFMGTAWSGEDH